MTIDATRSERRTALSFSVAALGAVVTLIMLFLPISVDQPGDHEAQMACGNAFDIEVILNYSSDLPEYESYWRDGYNRCTGARGDRLAKTVAALAVTVLLTATAAVWPRRSAPDR